MDQWNFILNALKNGQVIKDKDGRNVLTIAILNNAPLSVIDKLIDISPEFVIEANKEGSLPIHFALSRDKPNKRIISKLYNIFPNSLYIQNKKGLRPIDVINDVGTMQYIERLASNNTTSSSGRTP